MAEYQEASFRALSGRQPAVIASSEHPRAFIAGSRNSNRPTHSLKLLQPSR
jgi:hypothetical protein